MRRPTAALAVLGLLVTACAAEGIGREPLMCRIDLDAVPSSVVLTLQAVPEAQYIPCIEELRPGWDFQHVTAAMGRAHFSVDSDRLGDRFLDVTLTGSCDVEGADRGQSTEPGTRLWERVRERVTSTSVVVLPVAPRHREFAEWTAAILRSRDAGALDIDAAAVPSLDPMAERLAAAHAIGATVLLIDDRDVLDGTASVRRRDGSERAGLDLDDMVAAISETTVEPTYRATWYYTFDGGCVVMDIDAVGSEAGHVADDVDAAISLYDTDAIRELARRAGLDSAG